MNPSISRKNNQHWFIKLSISEEEPSNSGVSPEVPEKKEVLNNESKDNTTTNGSMFGSVFGSVFQKKDTPQATELQNGDVPPEVSVSPVIPDVPSVGVNSLQNKEDSHAEKVILEFDLRHPTIEEGAEPPDSGAGGLRSEETVSSSTRGGTREYTSDEATSSVLSTEPSTTSRPRNKSMFGRLALFMKRPKRRRLRKGSLEGTSGESSASNGVYQDTARPSTHSSMSLGAGNTNVKSDSPPPNIRDSSLPTRSQSVPVNQCHLISLSSSPTHHTPSSKPPNSHRTRQSEISEQSDTLKVNKRRSRDLPTEDFVLSDPEPEPALTTPRFAPYRAASVTDDNTCTPLPCTPLTNKNKKTRSSKNKQSSRTKQTFSSKDSDSSYYSSRKSSTTSRSKNKTRSHQKQGSRNNRQVRSKGRVSCRHEESTPINLFERGVEPQTHRGANSQVQKEAEIPQGMPALGRMLDNRGRCSMYPTSSSCPGTSIFDFLTWDEDTDSEFSTNTSLRKDTSSSSEGSITSLPSLATFHPDLTSLPPRPTHSADIFRNQVKPIGREGWERSRSVNDMRSPNSLSSAVTNFAVVRSPTKLTPPPPRRHHGDIFCLPNCFTPVNFDKAMLLE